ncbi:MAG: YsnF/AvaK domain-containing protein [Gemmatimonadaceae bacterium]|jgi:uncharacterized protein (TIGR02271 family)|nr:YsnF/AvaK domain-containing protein [Gemmatimonadaceae bacterium]
MADTTRHDDSFMDKLKRFFTGDDDQGTDDEYYRTRHASLATGTSGTSAASYDEARPAYRMGHLAGSDDRYANRSFDEAEDELRGAWSSTGGASGRDWSTVRDYARDAYVRGQEQRVVLSEEQLAVGKRQVQAGEVTLHKTVETEHVTEHVPLVREEVTIERRPLTGEAAIAASATIGEDEVIRVPLMAEEAVVEKRVVPVEEVIVRTDAVTETQVIDETVRRERLETSGVQDGTARLGDREVPLGSTSASSLDEDERGMMDQASRRLETTRDRIDDLRS